MKAADAARRPHDPPCTLLRGGVSERPKERASKARVGATSPWVQIPPPPPFDEKCLAREALLGMLSSNDPGRR